MVRIPSLRRGIAPTRDLMALRAIKRQLAGFAPDVVHTHASKAGALGRRALRGKAYEGLARVHTFHGHVLEGYFPAPVSKRLVGVEQRLARETDRIVAVSHRTADDLVRLQVAPEERIQVMEKTSQQHLLLFGEFVARERDELTNWTAAASALMNTDEFLNRE